jgi:hypothetical protein
VKNFFSSSFSGKTFLHMITEGTMKSSMEELIFKVDQGSMHALKDKKTSIDCSY